MEPSSFLEFTINGKTVAELLPGDPMVDTEAAYQLLRLFVRIYRIPFIFGYSLYGQVEAAVKKQYEAYLTGVAPEYQTDEDVKDISVLAALEFLREAGREAEGITRAIDSVWHNLTAKEELNKKASEIILALHNRANEGDELSKQVLDLIRIPLRAD